MLNAAKIPYVAVPETYTEQGIIEKIRMVAHAMDADARGTCLANAVAGDLAALKTLRAAVAKPVRVVFLLSFLNAAPWWGTEVRGQRHHRAGRRGQRHRGLRGLQAGERRGHRRGQARRGW